MTHFSFSHLDQQHMQHALSLAWQGRFSTSPNPRVGCVIAHGAQIVGQGFHLQAGQPHAEVYALRQAGALARHATAYVTLEPCAHYGRTPPCAEGLIQAGVARVVAAMTDPNPLVAGKGLAMLEQAGIQTQSGLYEQQARVLNRGFLSRIERKRPFVTLKTAASLDGKIALSNGQSQWITGQEAREDVQILRAQSCAILTGIGTVLADNPRLNVRSFPTLRQPIRIVADSRFQLPETCHLVQDGQTTWIATTQADDGRFQAYPNIRVLTLPADEKGKLDLHALLAQLAQDGIGELMIEAGANLTAAFLQQQLVDEMVHYQSSKILGNAAQSLFKLPENPQILTENSNWKTHSITPIGADIKWVLHHISSALPYTL